MSDTKTDKTDQTDHPAHYQPKGDADGTYEAINVIEALGWGEGFCKGNALKYLMRAGNKPGESEADDLKKAVWYLGRRLQQIENEFLCPVCNGAGDDIKAMPCGACGGAGKARPVDDAKG